MSRKDRTASRRPREPGTYQRGPRSDRGPSLKAELMRQLGRSRMLEGFVFACLKNAMDGNASFAREIWERVHGRETAHPPETGEDAPVKAYVLLSPDDWDREEGAADDGGR